MRGQGVLGSGPGVAALAALAAARRAAGRPRGRLRAQSRERGNRGGGGGGDGGDGCAGAEAGDVAKGRWAWGWVGRVWVGLGGWVWVGGWVGLGVGMGFGGEGWLTLLTAFDTLELQSLSGLNPLCPKVAC